MIQLEFFMLLNKLIRGLMLLLNIKNKYLLILIIFIFKKVLLLFFFFKNLFLKAIFLILNED